MFLWHRASSMKFIYRITLHAIAMCAAAVLIYGGLSAPWPASVDTLTRLVAGGILVATGTMIIFVSLRCLFMNCIVCRNSKEKAGRKS